MDQLKRNREKKDGIKLRTAEKVFSGEREDENVELSELYHRAGSQSRGIFFIDFQCFGRKCLYNVFKEKK